VLQLLSQGMTAARIGHTLGISPRTVHTHLAHLYRKLDVTDRVQAVMLGQRIAADHGQPHPVTQEAMPRPTQVVYRPGDRPVGGPLIG